MSYKAVLFDLDGTLLDTLTDLADSTNAMLRHFGFPEHPRDEYRYFVGDGIEVLIERALPADRRDRATVIECGRRMRTEYGERWAATTRPYPGVPELLDALAARGVPMAVLSNKPDEFTRLCVTRLLSRWQFDTVVGSGPSLPRKPDPAGATEVARRLGVAPAEILYLGDTNTDMQTSVAAGMFPVGALWGFRTADELTAAGARALAATPHEVLCILDG
ncbi:MAG: HAD-IA family hydrolase [Thermoguttaceae bacterium]